MLIIVITHIYYMHSTMKCFFHIHQLVWKLGLESRVNFYNVPGADPGCVAEFRL